MPLIIILEFTHCLFICIGEPKLLVMVLSYVMLHRGDS